MNRHGIGFTIWRDSRWWYPEAEAEEARRLQKKKSVLPSMSDLSCSRAHTRRDRDVANDIGVNETRGDSGAQVQNLNYDIPIHAYVSILLDLSYRCNAYSPLVS